MAGTLPNVCFVDPDMGAIDDVGGNIDGAAPQSCTATAPPVGTSPEVKA